MSKFLVLLLLGSATLHADDFNSAFAAGKAPKVESLEQGWFCYESFPQSKDLTGLISYLMLHYQVGLKFESRGGDTFRSDGMDWAQGFVHLDANKNGYYGEYAMFASLTHYILIRQTGKRMYVENAVKETPTPTFSKDFPKATLLPDARRDGPIRECMSNAELLSILKARGCRVEKGEEMLEKFSAATNELSPSFGPSAGQDLGVDLEAERLKRVEKRRQRYLTSFMDMCGLLTPEAKLKAKEDSQVFE